MCKFFQSMKLRIKFRSRPKRFQNRTESCLNCDYSLDISDRFCSYCGQKNSSKALTLKELLMEFFAGLFSYDSRFRKTIGALVLKPGKISRAYIEGKRISYVNPFRFFISTAIVFFLIISWINREELNDYKSISEEKSSALSESFDYEFDFDDGTPASKIQGYLKENPKTTYAETIAATNEEESLTNRLKFDFLKGYTRLQDNPKAYLNFLLPKLPFFLFFFVPIFTLFNILFYIRKKIPYTHHLIFNYNQQTVFLILLLLAIVISFVDLRIWLLIYVFYLYKSMRKFYAQNRFKTLIKQLLMVNCYFFSILFVLISFSILSIVFF